jgi:ammonium transporter, Amt family
LKRWLLSTLFLAASWLAASSAWGEDAPAADPLKKLEDKIGDVAVQADSAWMLISSALVMLMVPGLALFYGGMVRRKNILTTMMQSMVCLSLIGVYWIAIGYALAFGDPWLKIGDASILGWNPDLFFLRGVTPKTLLPNTNIPVYLHAMFQGMFAIITPALISGAVAERIRFKPYCLFLLVWVTLVYCPLAHCVWAMDWNWYNTLLPIAQQNADLLAKSGKDMIGLLGTSGGPLKLGALDFAGGTVVHIAAGLSSLAAILVLRRRLGYPEQSFHPNSMVLTLTGAGLLWFGWFGFNGGSALGSGTLATSAFSATQAAAAAAGLSWLVAEWWHRGKPTALGLASGIVAGLVAVTPASGYIVPWAGLVIGLCAGVVCYISVNLKAVFKYDDSLDAFGVHGVGGFLGAVLTGVFCSKEVNEVGNNGWLYDRPVQVWNQFVAAAATALFAFVASLVLVKLIDVLIGFVASDEEEITGLDRIEHGEVGMDLSLATESMAAHVAEPRPAKLPPGGQGKRFLVVVEGVNNGELMHAWSGMCQPNGAHSADFQKIYSHVTTVQGNRFQFRGGDQNEMRDTVQRLFQGALKSSIRAKVEASN